MKLPCLKLSGCWVLGLCLLSSSVWGQKFEAADKNGDKRLNVAELKAYTKGRVPGFEKFESLFKAMDKNKDGEIDASEFEERQAALDKVRGWKKVNPPLKVGEVAPTFKLKSLDGKSETNLASFKGKKPVVLIFGSYT